MNPNNSASKLKNINNHANQMNPNNPTCRKLPKLNFEKQRLIENNKLIAKANYGANANEKKIKKNKKQIIDHVNSELGKFISIYPGGSRYKHTHISSSDYNLMVNKNMTEDDKNQIYERIVKQYPSKHSHE